MFDICSYTCDPPVQLLIELGALYLKISNKSFACCFVTYSHGGITVII